MGIRSLNNIIKRFSPNAVSNHPITNYSGKKMAIDCSILLYKYRYSASNNDFSHIIGFINRVKFYLQYNITPIFVFDGLPPAAKRNVLIKRQSNKQKIYDKIDTLKKIEPKDDKDRDELNGEIKRLSSQIVTVKKCHVDECKELLSLLGVSYITAPDEAEKYCAYLQRNGIVDYTVSDDTDCLTFGCKNVLKTSIQGDLTEIDLDKLLTGLEMDMTSFVDFCILSGCDYCPYIPSVGSITALNSIIKHKNIETVIDKCNYAITNEFNFNEARGLFNDFNYDKPPVFTRGSIKSDELTIFLSERRFKEMYISKIIKKLNSL